MNKYRNNTFFQILSILSGIIVVLASCNELIYGDRLFRGIDLIVFIFLLLISLLLILSPFSGYVFEEDKLCSKFFSFNEKQIPYQGIIKIDYYFLMVPWYRILYRKNNRYKTQHILPLRNMNDFFREVENRCPQCIFDHKIKKMIKKK